MVRRKSSIGQSHLSGWTADTLEVCGPPVKMALYGGPLVEVALLIGQLHQSNGAIISSKIFSMVRGCKSVHRAEP